MKRILILAFMLFAIYGYSQSVDLPRNAKAGKCYIRCAIKDFNYNEKYRGSEWEEIDCSEYKKRFTCIDESGNEKISQDTYRRRLKFKKYKEKLIGLGYKIKQNLFVDNSFIKAHNKYLRKKKRAERKRLKNKV